MAKALTEYEEMVAEGIPQDGYLLVRLFDTNMIPTLTLVISFIRQKSNSKMMPSRFVLTYSGREISADRLAVCMFTM